MKVITYVPTLEDRAALRALWKEAFGDTDEFLNMFYTTAFAPNRVFALGEEGEDGVRLCGGLYWFDGSFPSEDGKTNQVAYIYAVAVAKEKRGLGYGKKLMEDVHTYLRDRGYHGVILAPAEEELFAFYEKLGYTTCTYRNDLHLQAARRTNSNTLEANRITKTEYSKLRATLLPKGGVVQDTASLDYLEQLAGFYAGENYVLAASMDGEYLRGVELLTPPEAGAMEVATQILEQSGCRKGIFRTPGRETKVTMYYPLQAKAAVPAYFGWIFD